MMDKKLDSLFSKKEGEGKKLPEHVKDAKLKVLKELRSEMAKLMGDKMSGLNKVTVASDSKEGLEAGLKKAEELMNKGPEGDEEDETASFHPMRQSIEDDAEMAEDGEFAPAEEEDESEADLDAKIQALLKKKEAASKKFK